MKYEFLKTLRSGIEEKFHAVEPRAVLPTDSFEWTKPLEASYPAIRKEAESVLKRIDEVINFDQVLPGQRALYQKDQWKSFFLKGLGKNIPAHAKHCPQTIKALDNVPGLINAFFSIHTPGLHIPPHRGPYAGILRYHMGLIIPEGDIGIKVAGETLRWKEGAGFVFDDSFEHEAWNYTKENRVILFIDFERPLPGMLSILNKSMLYAFKHSSPARKAQREVMENQLNF